VKFKYLVLLLLSTLGMSNVGFAGQAEIVKVMLEPSAHRWTFLVTIKHDDKGWDHYADGWRIVDAKGKKLGHRTLYHPHVKEQPFTRSLADVLIPKGTSIIYVEAHDKVHGWNKVKVRIDMKKDKGPRYQIRRKQ